MVVEDEDDIRMLVRFRFELESEFDVDGEAADIETAIDAAKSSQPDLIVLDHKLQSAMTGLEGAPLLKAVAPRAKIILFSASEELRIPATTNAYVDAFLLKTDIERLIPLARQLLGLNALR